MKAERKIINISVEYGDRNEVIEALKKVLQNLRNPNLRYDRRMENTALVEWSIKNATIQEYREENINGVWCQVYQSRMNEPIGLKAKNYGKF